MNSPLVMQVTRKYYPRIINMFMLREPQIVTKCNECRELEHANWYGKNICWCHRMNNSFMTHGEQHDGIHPDCPLDNYNDKERRM